MNSNLRAYNKRLESMEQDLSVRSRKAENALAEYESAGRGMSEIAKRYAELMKERDGVKSEIRKLESRASDVD